MTACELLLRPGKPARVLREEVKQDALSTTSPSAYRSTAGQSEDLLGDHLTLTGTTYPADLLGRVIAVNEQAGTVLIQLKIHVAAQMNAKYLADP